MSQTLFQNIFHEHENARYARINQFLIQSRGQTYYFLRMDVPSDFKQTESSLGRVKIPFMEIFCAQYEQ